MKGLDFKTEERIRIYCNLVRLPGYTAKRASEEAIAQVYGTMEKKKTKTKNKSKTSTTDIRRV